MDQEHPGEGLGSEAGPTSRDSLRAIAPPAAVFLLGAGLRLLWVAFTNFTQEDAFITFRFAYQLALGNGFVYNLGERVYGTTSPLFTLLLAAWLNLTQGDVISGARGIDFFAALGSMLIVWLCLRHLDFSRWQPAFVLAVLAFSTQLWVFDTQGMETPLVLFFVAASWWMFTRDRPTWAGIMAGLMLWTRIDTAVWLLSLVGAAWLTGRLREGLKICLYAGLVYLPWVVFAWVYFGSPIPHSAIAKWVAYVSRDFLPLSDHAVIIFRAMKPFFIDSALSPSGLLLSFATITIGLWYGFKSRNNRSILVLMIFGVADALRLIITRATSFSHYAVPAMWAFMILLGAGLAELWGARGSFRPWARRAYPVALLVILALGLAQGMQAAYRTQDNQVFRHELSLKAIGEWLRKNTAADATVLVEPLGYIGYYSERHMYDEVGLVTPKIVELKRQGLTAPDYVEVLKPDYYVIHCDDALRWLAGDEPDAGFFVRNYTRRVAFNPVAFDPGEVYEDPSYAAFARNACYEVWGTPR